MKQLDIRVLESKNPKLFQYLQDKRDEKCSGSMSDILCEMMENSIEYEKKTKQFEKDLIGMRLAIRQIEKNSWYAVQLMNNFFVHEEYEPVTMAMEQSPNLVKIAQEWNEFLLEQQRKKANATLINGKG
jgi:hypothetical protein